MRAQRIRPSVPMRKEATIGIGRRNSARSSEVISKASYVMKSELACPGGAPWPTSRRKSAALRSVS